MENSWDHSLYRAPNLDALKPFGFHNGFPAEPSRDSLEHTHTVHSAAQLRPVNASFSGENVSGGWFLERWEGSSAYFSFVALKGDQRVSRVGISPKTARIPVGNDRVGS